MIAAVLLKKVTSMRSSPQSRVANATQTSESALLRKSRSPTHQKKRPNNSLLPSAIAIAAEGATVDVNIMESEALLTPMRRVDRTMRRSSLPKTLQSTQTHQILRIIFVRKRTATWMTQMSIRHYMCVLKINTLPYNTAIQTL